MEEEFLNSVLLCSKDLVGTSLTIPLLNPSSLVKDKDAITPMVLARLMEHNLSKSSVVILIEDALLLEEEVENANLILKLMIANMFILSRSMIAFILREPNTLDSHLFKASDKTLEVDVSVELYQLS